MAFNIGFYAYAIIGHTRANQLLPQLLMEQFEGFCKGIDGAFMGRSTPTTAFDGTIWYFANTM